MYFLESFHLPILHLTPVSFSGVFGPLGASNALVSCFSVSDSGAVVFDKLCDLAGSGDEVGDEFFWSSFVGYMNTNAPVSSSDPASSSCDCCSFFLIVFCSL